MNKRVLTFGIIAIVLIVAGLTNPKQAQHRDAVKEKFKDYVRQSLKGEEQEQGDVWQQAGEALASVLGDAVLNQVTDNLVSADNYIFFSLTKLRWNGSSEIIGIGIFGNVFLTKKIDKALSQGLFPES